uniref:Putative trypsin n=2 Tax=Anopheles marajoara TaxID=58244 RepID=A0A2M4BUN3_9DIPT
MALSEVKLILLLLLLGGEFCAKAQQDEVSDLETDAESTDSTDVDEQQGTNHPSDGNRIGRIYNGAPAASANQLYPALLMVYSSSTVRRLSGFIGGPQQIITSASALVAVGDITGIDVYVGNTPKINTTLAYGASSFGRLRKFNATTLEYDVGFVDLTGNLNNDPRRLGVLSLATTEIAVSTTNRTKCVVIGWGQSANGSDTYILSQADYELLTDQECTSAFGQSLHPTLLCARSVQGYACDFDGGAPLVCNNEVYGILTDQSGCTPSSTAKVQKFANLPVIFSPPATAPTNTTAPAPTPAAPPRKNYISCP